jgi:hypothetical protein
VHVENPSAYKAFSEGKVIFGLATEAAKIRTFKDGITSEFGSAIVERPNTVGGDSLIFLYHKHRAQERIYSSDTMKKIIREHPDLA